MKLYFTRGSYTSCCAIAISYEQTFIIEFTERFYLFILQSSTGGFLNDVTLNEIKKQNNE